MVVASARPLQEADLEAKRALDDLRKPPKKGDKPKKKLAALSLRTRGLVLSGEEDGVRAKSDAHGVALFRFSFKHTR